MYCLFIYLLLHIFYVIFVQLDLVTYNTIVQIFARHERSVDRKKNPLSLTHLRYLNNYHSIYIRLKTHRLKIKSFASVVLLGYIRQLQQVSSSSSYYYYNGYVLCHIVATAVVYYTRWLLI